MNATDLACPRCGQDWVVEVRLRHINLLARFCPDCEALWPGVQPRKDNFVDYGTFMKSHGRTEPDDPNELEILGRYTVQRGS